MDILLEETGNGGDLVRKTKDLSIVLGFQNMVYLGMFGGNVLESTPTRRGESEQAFDYWGNTLIFKDDPDVQFNSETERVLNTISINSFGRVTIEDAVKKDLQFMNRFCKVSVEVAILGLDKIQIIITLIKPSNLQRTEFIYIWDSTMKELTESSFTPVVNGSSNFKIFDDSFDFSFE